MNSDLTPDRNLSLESVRATEAAAIAAVRLMGNGDESTIDNATVNAMRSALNTLSLDGTVRIGDGMLGSERKLSVGDKVGNGTGVKVDVAVVALEGKSIVARGGYNALSVLATAEDGGFLSVPELYMDKIAVGPQVPKDAIDLDNEPADNIKAVAEAKGVKISDLVVCMLDRPRHGQLIAKVRDAGARICLILDGDVSGAIASGLPTGNVDVYMGIGGAQQGVLAAAALKCFGAQMQSRLIIRNHDDALKARAAGIEDFKRKYQASEMAEGNVTFAATGVTDSSMLKGVKLCQGVAITHSIITRSRTGTFRVIEGHHDFSRSDK
ncbi:MAG: fructose-bisphosphatase class II [Rhodospirillaceae bacterium TMED8]|nr:fructose-bisphosphatase class II [Magnetovibrio sp.]OUT51602.1 MAG: fructose-bisphosphatase class II [Rhodospirillaceae bacterium TMED8]|tara:strand:- start:33 stop:1004 length:972 start_codon:yes stop_codon:yes gene_type:complete